MNESLYIFVKENYTLVKSSKTMRDDGVVNIHKANCMRDVPQDLIEYILYGLSIHPEGVRGLFEHNCDYGVFDATYVVEYRSKRLINVYINAILRRPFTEAQDKTYLTSFRKMKWERVKFMYDSANE